MIIKLDSDACQGHGRCYALAPALFDSDDEGFSVLKVDGEVPEDQHEAARLAADNCPEFAITIEE
ncbi:MAG: ferredoxin [Acidimicrobiales bacterium]|nr:ferredoxin [Acidimicrobiales bacterium]